MRRYYKADKAHYGVMNSEGKFIEVKTLPPATYVWRVPGRDYFKTWLKLIRSHWVTPN